MTDDQRPDDKVTEADGRTADSGTQRPPSRTWLVATVAAFAGFVAVYVSLPSPGNDVASVTVTTAPAETKPVAAAPTGSSLKAFAKGAMGTFVAKTVPAVLPEVTFRDFSAGDDGVSKTMADWKGKVVLVNLWATWCAPCRKEMPDLAKLKDELGGADFDLLAVSIDRGGPAKPRKFLTEIKADNLGVYQAKSSEIAGPYKAFGMPTTLLIGRDGKELGRLVGPADWASDEAKALIMAAIAG